MNRTDREKEMCGIAVPPKPKATKAPSVSLVRDDGTEYRIDPDEDFNERTAKRLKEAMYDARMNSAELSERTGIAPSTISHYLSAKHGIGNMSALKIAKALGVNVEWLMGFETPKKLFTDAPTAVVEGYAANDVMIDVTKQADIFARYMSMPKEKRELVDALILQLSKGGE